MKTHSFCMAHEIEKENGFYEKIIWNSKRNR